MKTNNIYQVVKQFDDNRVIISISAFDKNNNKLFSYHNENGISSSIESMQIFNLLHRKNDSFKCISNTKNAAIYQKSINQSMYIVSKIYSKQELNNNGLPKLLHTIKSKCSLKQFDRIRFNYLNNPIYTHSISFCWWLPKEAISKYFFDN